MLSFVPVLRAGDPEVVDDASDVEEPVDTGTVVASCVWVTMTVTGLAEEPSEVAATTEVKVRVVAGCEVIETVVVEDGWAALDSTVVVDDGERMDEDTAEEMEERMDEESIDEDSMDEDDEVTGGGVEEDSLVGGTLETDEEVDRSALLVGGRLELEDMVVGGVEGDEDSDEVVETGGAEEALRAH